MQIYAYEQSHCLCFKHWCAIHVIVIISFVMHTIQIYAQVFLFNLYTVTSIDTPKEVIVKTANGYISGLELQDYNNNLYYAFQSVPYAQPPIGDLRFLPPKESLPWVGVKDGTRESPQCVQPAGPTFVGQEDCLYLNVYTNAVRFNTI